MNKLTLLFSLFTLLVLVGCTNQLELPHRLGVLVCEKDCGIQDLDDEFTFQARLERGANVTFFEDDIFLSSAHILGFDDNKKDTFSCGAEAATKRDTDWSWDIKSINVIDVKKLSPTYLIFRLPFIVGPGLKRNSVYDLTHNKKTYYTFNSQINWIHTDTIAKSIITILKKNIKLSNASNIFLARMSDEETLQAVNNIRKFKRLKNINLEHFDFQSIFIDPPRQGLEVSTLERLKKFQQIIYISCGFSSLKRDLNYLLKTHRISSAGLFDQFPYTDHIESAVVLKKIQDK